MDDLSNYFDDLRLRYREAFLECADAIVSEILALKPANVSGEIFDNYYDNSDGKLWQLNVLDLLKNKFLFDIEQGLVEISSLRDSFDCAGCGVCCRLACSEFSPSELFEKADNGDNYASQFIRIFVPYNSEDVVKAVFPQYLDMLKNRKEEGYYFYHCPKVTTDNRCPDYANRPQICRDFPDNPLAFLPLSCSYKNWKLKAEPVSLKVNALSEIVNFYIENLNKVI